MKTNNSCGHRCLNFGCTLKSRPDETPCSEKCICYLTGTLMQLKNKILEQTRMLKEFAVSNDQVRCNVELTPSEDKLFGAGVVKDDSMVCCVLVRELRAQKGDLEGMMARWVEFADKADCFAVVITDLRDKLSELTHRIDTIIQESKALEEIELANEESRSRQINQALRRSEERREIIRETVDRYAEAEARDHLEHLAKRDKLDALERDRLMDRAALKLALERIMRIMINKDSSEVTKNAGISATPIVSKPEPNDRTRFPVRIESLNNPEYSASNEFRSSQQEHRIREETFPALQTFCERTTARRPF